MKGALQRGAETADADTSAPLETRLRQERGIPQAPGKGIAVPTSERLQSAPNSDIIRSSIESPIESRHSFYGRPSAISTMGAPLTKRQKSILKALPSCDSKVTVPKRMVSMKDLAALTAKTGVEYAMFTRKGERLIIRGDATFVKFTPQMAKMLASLGYKWSGHTHPGEGRSVKMASDGDYSILRAFGQKRSVIYDQFGGNYVFEVK